MIQFFRPFLNVTAAIFVFSLVTIGLACPCFGRVPLLMLVAGFFAYATCNVVRRLKREIREQAITALLVVAFYSCSAVTSVKPEELTTVRDAGSYTGFYPALTESLLKFKLTLPVEPSSKILAIANPYVPKRDYPYVWDASYYQGKYYVYHGITPVLALFLPFRVITGQSLPIEFGLLAFLAAGFVGSVFVLERARRACGFQRPAIPIQVLSVLLLGCASMCPLILRRPAVYEQAISGGYCFSMWGTYFLIGQFERRGRAGAVLASLCVGLCVGSRPTYGVAAALLVAAFVLQVRSHWQPEKWAAVMRSISLLVPFGVVAFFLGLYNWLRFGSFTEFGLHYQLDHLDMYHARLDATKMVRGIGYYLFSTPVFSTHFPGLHADHTTSPFHLPHHDGIHEDVLGVFTTMPVCYFLVIAPLVAWYRKSRGLLVFTMVLGGFAGLMVLAVSNIGVSARYELDFVPSLLLASTLVFYGMWDRAMPRLRLLAEVLWIPAACFSIIIGVLASVSDYQNHSLESFHPSTFQLLRHLLWPAGARFDATK
jgi:hypothetical protein